MLSQFPGYSRGQQSEAAALAVFVHNKSGHSVRAVASPGAVYFDETGIENTAKSVVENSSVAL